MPSTNEQSIGDAIGEALRPVREGAMTKTILEQLRESIRELDAEIAEEEARLDDLNARRLDLLAEEDRIKGDLLAMEFHRADARNRRERTPESGQACHVAWVRWQAATHIENGTVPSPGSWAAEEVEAEMDRQRGGVRQ